MAAEVYFQGPLRRKRAPFDRLRAGASTRSLRSEPPLGPACLHHRDAAKLDRPFLTLTQPAALAIHNAAVPRRLEGQRAQGRKKKMTVLRLWPIGHLETWMRRVAWREATSDVFKHSRDQPVICRHENLLAARDRSV